MGYTHYWDKPDEVKKENLARAMDDIKDIVERHKDVLAFEYDERDKPPMVSLKKGIWFNGKGDDGHETFCVFAGGDDWSFCKTASKPYDQAVCECLLVLRSRVPGFRVSSDGFSGYLEQGVKFKGTWPEAMKAVEKYGLHYEGFISRERTPYCDFGMKLAEDGVDGVRIFDHEGVETPPE